MHENMAMRAQDEMNRNRRYRWYGEVSRGALRRQLARCWLMVLSSKLEGGANVLSEAISAETPVLSSRIPGSVGLLGKTYQGYFRYRKTSELRTLLRRCEDDAGFYARLARQVAQRRPLVEPARELKAWRALLAEL